jgi:hypothetical protein
MDLGNARGVNGRFKNKLAREDEGNEVTLEENFIVTLSGEEWDGQEVGFQARHIEDTRQA